MPEPKEMPAGENMQDAEQAKPQRDSADPNAPTLEEALKQIAALDKEIAEMKDKMLRALADTENTRRRAERDREDTAKFAVAGFSRDLLPVSDNLKRALEAVPEGQRGGNAIYEGVAATERELMRVLEKNGIKKIEPLGQKFDPHLHEVIFEMPSADKEAGTVLQVVEAGYMIHERLLRPARVGIAKNDGTPAPESGGIVDQEV
ncbi:MAG: nucleotide exchange factor GrpE [Alphaproteobacteria bacterium]|nr:nucleotide exchange factor GrpE [Alphaproteobacteria bacterium]